MRRLLHTGLVPVDSAPRRLAKRLLGATLPPSVYQRVLAASVVRDLRADTLREPELDLVPALLREGDTALDVGANHAMWSASMSKAVGITGRVVAFEPVPFTAGTFLRIIRRLGLVNVDLIQVAVAEKAGRLTLAVPIQASGVADSARVHLAARDGGDEPTSVRRIEVDAISLDDRLEELSEVALLKIDIEGAELFALRGAAALIARDHPTIICEVDPEFLEGFGLTPAELAGVLTDHGYGCHRYLDRASGLEPVAIDGDLTAGNYVFLHPSRADRAEAAAAGGTPYT